MNVCDLVTVQGKMQAIEKKFKFTMDFFCEDWRVSWKQQPVAFITHFYDLLEAVESARKDKARIEKVGGVIYKVGCLLR